MNWNYCNRVSPKIIYNSNMNNFHIYEEVGRGKDSVVYKVFKLTRAVFNSY